MKALRVLLATVWLSYMLSATVSFDLSHYGITSMGIGIASESKPTQLFIRVCSQFFQNPDSILAMDKEGNNVSNRFYREYVESFNQGDFETIWNAFQAELTGFEWNSHDVENLSVF